MLAKYPAFLFAPRYATATGKSLLSGYRQQGTFPLVFFGLSTLGTMFIATAANLLITAGLAKVALGLDFSIITVGILFSVAAMTLLIIGQYHWLDLVIKVLVVFLTLATLAATFMALPMIDWATSGAFLPGEFDVVTVLFIAALIGWMPTPLDVSIWQSQWSVAKMRDTGFRPSQRQASIDFNIGYITTVVLAICFVVLGTAVMHGSGTEFEGSPTLFASQIIGLYEQALGPWSGLIVGVAAMLVMFSTYLTILDGFPRGLANLALMMQGKEEVAAEDSSTEDTRHKFYWATMVIMVIGALAIMNFFLGRLQLLVDFAATVSFLGAPVFAYLNHRAIHGPEVPIEAQPGPGLRIWSICGIVALSAFAILYLYLAFLY